MNLQKQLEEFTAKQSNTEASTSSAQQHLQDLTDELDQVRKRAADESADLQRKCNELSAEAMLGRTTLEAAETAAHRATAKTAELQSQLESERAVIQSLTVAAAEMEQRHTAQVAAVQEQSKRLASELEAAQHKLARTERDLAEARKDAASAAKQSDEDAEPLIK